MRIIGLLVLSLLTLASCSDGSGPGSNACEGRECGEVDGVDCGSCLGATEACGQQGLCEDLCADRECGEVNGLDCGICPGATEACNEQGLCEDLCAGRECGEPAPGITCGQCSSPEICGLPGRCFVPGGCPAGMVEVGLTGVCIDAYEVTCTQMAAFLNEHGNECRIEGLVDLNDRYTCYLGYWDGEGEEFGLYESAGSWYVTQGYEDYPVVLVPYVGARLACEHWGKRLCTQEEWARACEGPDSTAFPYGDTYEPLTCNSYRKGEDCPDCPPEPYVTEPVGSYPGCEGGYPGLFDMIGNVSEWVYDTVEDQYGEMYNTEGASAGYANVRCREPTAGGASRYPYYAYTTIGFRCCYYLD